MANEKAEPAGGEGALEPSFLDALPHFLPLAVFPLIVNAAIYGGWWIAAPFVFFMLAGPLDDALGAEERNMDPADHRTAGYGSTICRSWLWAALWLPTLVFGLWQILVAGHLSAWEGALMALVLAGEAQAGFIVGHELIHRRSLWERRVGEFLLASTSYPQYATEHIYIHHALVGTPMDLGSAPRGQSIWNYFRREVASNLTGAWRVEREGLARRGLAVWHYTNPFWRYTLETGAWYSLIYWMGGIWAILAFAALCLIVVFSMKLSNYIQHYGLRRARFYPGIEDWSAYDSPAFAARPDAFEAIDEIFGAAPRLVPWIDRAPELLDTLQDREFTDLDLPRGFGPDPEAEAIARRGLARLYWTHEYSVSEMRQQIADIPVVGVDDTIETVRNWSNGRAFQVGVHTLRGNLSPIEAGTALSNIAEASIASVLAAVAEDVAGRRGARGAGGLAAAVLGDLASREAVPGAGIDMLFVHDGGEPAWYESLRREFAGALRALSEGSLVFAPGRSEWPVRSLAQFEELGHDDGASGELLDLTRARCIFTAGDPTAGVSFDAARCAILTKGAARDALIADLGKPAGDAPAPGLAAIDDMRGGLRDIERAARLLQVMQGGDSRSPAATVFEKAGADGAIPKGAAERLAAAARLWRNLSGALGLAVEDAAVEAAGAGVGAFLAQSCGSDDFDALAALIGETATRAAADVHALEGIGVN